MGARDSQFPVRLQGIWRAGRLRPSDYVPATAVARARRRSRRAEADADAQALLLSSAQGDDEAGAITQDLQDRLGRLAGALGEAEAQAREQLDDAREASAARAAEAMQALRSPPRGRRSAVALLAPLVMVFIVVTGVLSQVTGFDLEAGFGKLLARAERTLADLAGESLPAPVESTPTPAPSPPEPAPAASLVRNGGFEQPPLAGMEDMTVPAGWRFEGNRPYLRRAAGSAGYPADAAGGSVVMSLEGERHGLLYQDLGLMQSGVTYTFRATVMHAAGRNAWRAAFARIDGGRRTELAWTGERKVAPPEHGSFPVSFSYTATPQDGGRLLRLELSDNASGEPTRAALDDISVRAAP